MPVNELHDPRKIPWLLWLAAPFVCYGIICLIVAVVVMLIEPCGFLMVLLGGAGR